MPDRVGVDLERHIVEEDAAVDLRDIDLALEPVAECGQGADDVVSEHPDVAGGVAISAGGRSSRPDTPSC